MLFETHVFIVRLWREHGDQASQDSVWRGSVEKVPDGQRTYFRTLKDLTETMVSRSGFSEMDSGG